MNNDEFKKGIASFTLIYGSVIGISFLTDWKVGLLLIAFAWGHNIEKH